MWTFAQYHPTDKVLEAVVCTQGPEKIHTGLSPYNKPNQTPLQIQWQHCKWLQHSTPASLEIILSVQGMGQEKVFIF